MPRKVLDEAFEAVLASIAAGATQAEAARTNGVSPRTVSSWLEHGRRDPESSYGVFAEGVDEIRERRLHPSDDEGPIGSIEELQGLVWKAVEAGSVQAMKLCWEMLRWRVERDRDRGPNPFAELPPPPATR